MVRLTLLICSRKVCLYPSCWMTNVSSTYLIHSLGGVEALWRAFLSKCSIYKLANMELTSDLVAAPSTCSWNWFWNENMYCVGRTLVPLWFSALKMQFYPTMKCLAPVGHVWVHWYRSEQCSYIIWAKKLSWLESNHTYPLNKVFSTMEMMQRFSY